MRFDYHTQYREGFALWRSPFDRNLYALLLLVLCALPWFMTPFMLGEMAYVFILCVASLGLMASRVASISGVRRTTHTGCPRHSARSSMPGSMAAISTSTGAPAALARSLGNQLATNGTATAAAPAAPIADVAASSSRRRWGISAPGAGGVKDPPPALPTTGALIEGELLMPF
jgi:hypothetical protein